MESDEHMAAPDAVQEQDHAQDDSPAKDSIMKDESEREVQDSQGDQPESDHNDKGNITMM